MLRIFMPVKIQRLRPGLNPQTWVPEASMLTTRPPKPSYTIHTIHTPRICNFCKSAITNMATVRNSDVMSDRF